MPFNPEHQDGELCSQRNGIQLEKAAVLFNLGAICSQIAASCDRTTALGRHLAMESFKVAANFFFQLWNVFAKDVVSATLDLTLLFAEFLHHLFSAQASELELQQQLNNNDNSYALQQHRYAPSFVSVCELYVKAYVLILDVSSAAALKHVYCFDQDQTWITHLLAKRTFFEAEAAACLRQSFSKRDLQETQPTTNIR
ncbi:vacuolar-sorting protein BRO1-like isoform X2 [Arachis stenosperma]|uniref:vacuolar-sorting protein BRO1-like isoform X2 n=1 Tax=Arachis stenosperma TaxID=217475 RepID=UPI0025AC8FEC|nr:vacuolar-sorting protein BRO1-like isoform X2 [Arachis stenosperma]